MEDKSLSMAAAKPSAMWPMDWAADVNDPVADPQEFLLNFPTLADHDIMAEMPSGLMDFDLTTPAEAPAPTLSEPTFKAPKKSALAVDFDELSVESTLAIDYRLYISMRL